MPHKILILAGTHDARLLANRLVADGHYVTSSFAGVTAQPLLPEGNIRSGGFGGVEGMKDYIAREQIDILVDATHPFAAIISQHAAEAMPSVLRLERPAWVADAGDIWIDVNDNAAAVAALPFEAKVLLTIGRKEVAAFTSRPDLSGIARMIEAPQFILPSQWQLMLQRPPFSLEAEIALMRGAEISHLVTKNAGGAETAEKLSAARALGIPVVMIARPAKPQVSTFHTVDAIAGFISSR